jgi:DNA-binding response OmpR family regulator
MSAPDGTVTKRPRLLIVDDDDRVRERLVDGFKMDDFVAGGARDLATARAMLSRGETDLVLLDVNLPDGTGFRLLSELRCGDIDAAGRPISSVPVIMLSARGSEDDRIRGFERGCDDYVVKPYSFVELRSRVSAVLRRMEIRPHHDFFDLGELQIDARRRHVLLAGRVINLTEKEFVLLLSLAAEPERVVERGRLLGDLWGFSGEGSTRTLDAHACRLRGKLSGGRRNYVLNAWGVGYRLFAPEGPA